MSHTPSVTHRVVPTDPAGHRFTVTTTVHTPDPAGQVLRLPTWIPGSYLVREFAKNFETVRAAGPEGPIPIDTIDKATWRAAPVDGPLTVTVVVYAWDLSVRMAHLDQTHGYFNGTSMFLEAVGQGHLPQRVVLEPPADATCRDWKVATTLPALDAPRHGFGVFQAADYDELTDHPVEMGTWTHGEFEAVGTLHEIAITGHHRCDMARLERDLAKICETHVRLFDTEAPVDRYLFQVMAVGNGYGGLEHRASTSLICKREDLPQVGVEPITDGYRQFLGLCSHEYFHTWNVKRIKPAAFVPYDLSKEANTTLLWAFEGITSYYDDLGLLRAGLITSESYLELVGQSMSRVFVSGGRHKQPVASSSFDAWTKFYRQDENAPNAIVSYYTKGALVALALDLTIRAQTDGRRSLDDVMRRLWADWKTSGGAGVSEDGIERAAIEVSGLDLRSFFDTAVRGTEDLDLVTLLAGFGVTFSLRPAKGPGDKGGKPVKNTAALRARGDLGAGVAGKNGDARVTHVFEGGPAHRAGLSAKDVIVAMDGLRVSGTSLLEQIGRRAPGDVVELLGFRRDELMRFEITVGAPAETRAVLVLDTDADPDATTRRDAWFTGSQA